MKKFLFLGIMLFYTTISFACHKEIGDPFIGHHKWSKRAGALIYTENATASVSTSSWCNTYTGFLHQKYDAISMEAAIGDGPHINVLAAFEGCPVEVYPEFSQSLKLNYLSIFDQPKAVDGVQIRKQIGKMVSANDLLRFSCKQHDIET